MRYTRPGTRWVRRVAATLVTTLMVLGLLIPSTAVAAPAQSMVGGDEWARVYTVRPGDTLAEIALSFGVTQAALMSVNGIRNANKIYIGQQLVIPDKDMNRGTGGPVCGSYHTVRRADTLSEIALRYGVESWELARANGIYDLNEIYAGQRLCIPDRGGSAMQGGWMEPEPMARQWSEPDMPQRGVGGPVMESDRPMSGPMEPERSGPPEPQRGDGGPMDAGYTRPGDRTMDGPWEPDRDGPMMGPDGDMSRDWKGPESPDYDGPSRGRPMQPDEYWKGTYFSDKYYTEFALERKDLEVNFNWFTGSPFSDMPADRFSVRWEKIEYFRGGQYRFFAVADDGVRVIVDDQTIIDAWVIQPATEYKADLYLPEGLHKLVVEYYEEAEDAQIHVYWEPKRK